MTPPETRKISVELLLTLRNSGISKNEAIERIDYHDFMDHQNEALHACKDRGELDHIIEFVWNAKKTYG